ncbi:aminotransferase [Anaerocolumna cellulosilytica]|uniref:Aminotransferase n=1 Tax=Anaerocolumna cellulosilytica TaxID=433286 RepID=A0A6S6QY70_9FIRM|nr:DegT/DnrJ/EryC1/StrS family aminotransferase [Anaerocolumna cellulosilytica]MBB5194098.1 dTDP-4-amino-4,6-dideoxygalactose transaminase [Anaerocolumna cellulosilytica]BCJ94686.1 aminotransferase [Anaerocolumna cellulosilytica]
MSEPINVTRSSMPDFNEYLEEIKDLWNTRWLTNMGVKHQKLEVALADYLQSSYVTLFTNGHMALENTLEAFSLTGEVITTPFTFASTTHAIVRKGLTPVFCDINKEDYTIDVTQIKKLITKKTSAILPVHVYGNVCDTIKIEELAKEYDLKVIYDAAHTFGVRIAGKSSGEFGDASVFSFHATKVFHTIEGGAVTYHDSTLQPILMGLKNFGITDYEKIDYIGGNSKMNEFQAAMGLCNLRHLKEEINKRKAVYERYHRNLSGISGITLNRIPDLVESNYAYYPVLFDGYSCTRDEIYQKLRVNGVYSRKYFYPLTSQFECYKGVTDTGDTPVAEYIAQRILTLPIYPELEFDQIDRICEIIKS